MRLSYHPVAEAALLQAAVYYERQVKSLGAQFLDAESLAIRSIQDNSERCSIVEEDIRQYLMRRFPYAIYFRIHLDELRILAIKHHSRHPDYWRYRTSE